MRLILKISHFFIALILIAELFACDPLARMNRIIYVDSVPSQNCITKAAKEIKGLDNFEVRPWRNVYIFERGSANIVLTVLSDGISQLEFEFHWIGFSDSDREIVHIALLQDAQESIMKNCGINISEVKIKDECAWVSCPSPRHLND